MLWSKANMASSGFQVEGMGAGRKTSGTNGAESCQQPDLKGPQVGPLMPSIRIILSLGKMGSVSHLQRSGPIYTFWLLFVSCEFK